MYIKYETYSWCEKTPMQFMYYINMKKHINEQKVLKTFMRNNSNLTIIKDKSKGFQRKYAFEVFKYERNQEGHIF